MAHLGVLQIDAVNAVARSQLLVLRPRLMGDRGLVGNHDSTLALLNRAAYSPTNSSANAVPTRGAQTKGAQATNAQTASAKAKGAQASSAQAKGARELTEYPCHEACYCAVEDWPLYRWRMKRGEEGEMWKPLAKFVAENPTAVDQALTNLERHGPCSAGELEQIIGADTARPPKRKGQWSQWTPTKLTLGWLFWAGYVGVAERANFVRRYDLIERVLPAEVVARKMTQDEAQRGLLMQAAKCLGVATAADLTDYHRLPKRETPARLEELMEQGALVRTEVQGWSQNGYRPAAGGASGARRTTGRGSARGRSGASGRGASRRSQSVLLSPFDPLVWFRPRAEQMFGFTYRLEIYTPAAKRQYGYYVLPFLHEDCLAGRVDVKTDRADGVLRVLGAFAEQDAHASGGGTGASGAAGVGSRAGVGSKARASSKAGWQTPVEVALAQELIAAAQWLGVDDVAIAADARGDLAKPLRRALAAAS